LYRAQERDEALVEQWLKKKYRNITETGGRSGLRGSCP
jgi:hypothetical protein